jgi:hypothetical protein
MTRSKGTTLAWVGLTIIVAGTIPALWAAGELAGGLTELLRHWWSTVATLPLGVGILTTMAGLVKVSRTRSSPAD